jgi:hypothetical protein
MVALVVPAVAVTVMLRLVSLPGVLSVASALPLASVVPAGTTGLAEAPAVVATATIAPEVDWKVTGTPGSSWLLAP